jgi:hypothetical protein
LEEFSTITVQTFFWFVDIGGIVDQHKTKESLSNSHGQQFHQYQQNKRKL